MKVSILMPFYNAEKWLGATLKSIVSQSYTDWELICIDDFSEDKSMDIIRSFKSTDNRIKLIRNQTKGIISALQIGLKHATSEFITRMDADDIMPSERLNKMVTKLKVLPPKSIVTGKVKYFSDTAHISEGYIKYQNWINELCEQQNHYTHIYRECIVASPNWLVRKSDLIDCAIFDKLEYPEDYSMCFLWHKNDFNIYGLDDITLLWREHPERTSRNSPIYDQPSFFSMKLNWFCENHPEQKISLLGAGTKGKLAAKLLIDSNKSLDWFDFKHDNYNTNIFGLPIQDYNDILGNKLLIAIYPNSLNELLDFLRLKGFEIGVNAWFL